MGDIPKAIYCFNRALAALPEGHPKRPTALNNASASMLAVYVQTGDRRALDNGIGMSRAALSASNLRDGELADYEHNLANYLLRRYNREGGERDLQEAVELSRRAALTTGEQHPKCGHHFVVVAEALELRYRRLGEASDLDDALSYLRKAGQSPHSTPLVRILAARRALRLLIEFQDLGEADKMAELALSILPYVANRQLNREDQQYALDLVSVLAADACSLSLLRGDAAEALTRAEFRRCVVLGYLIDSQSDISDLQLRNPAVAQSYEAARSRAFQPIGETETEPIRQSLFQARREAMQRWNALEAEIRRQPGFETFLQPTSAEELKKHAKEGPIIIVNVTNIGAHALIVSIDNIRLIPLPQMLNQAPTEFRQQIEQYRQRGLGSDSRNVTPVNLQKAEMGTWLWSACIRPILDSLPESRELHRVWWIGSGFASSLPFHAAAECSDDSFDGCLERTVSSYAISMKGLSHCRKSAFEAKLLGTSRYSVLVVAMPETPGQTQLPGVDDEVLKIREATEGQSEVKILRSPSVKQALAEIPECSIAHFACHGHSDPIDPGNSHLLLQKRNASGNPENEVDTLTVSALLDNVNQSRAPSWMAYLSACSTAQVRAASLYDENLHLASTFQVAGFAHVVGSLWPTGDAVCAEIAFCFYNQLLRNLTTGSPDRGVAFALREAILEVRRRRAGLKFIDWAPYVHFGP